MNRPSEPERSRLAGGADFMRLPVVSGAPVAAGLIRSAPEDFRVAETLPFELSGAGEHFYVLIRKAGQNTRWVGKQFARALNLPYRAIGYAGLKDRRAVTDQWFSIHLPGRPDPDPSALELPGVSILKTQRHSTKLKVGAVAGNRFNITVRELTGDLADLTARLHSATENGVPNYFGPQRFGNNAANLSLLDPENTSVSVSREQRSFGLSSLRSALFNLFLAERIDDGSWRTPLEGEILFCNDRYVHESRQRESAAACCPTGLLWGVGENSATGPARVREEQFIAAYPSTLETLIRFDVRMKRRELIAEPKDFSWDLSGDVLQIEFGLRRGQYATAVLHELLSTTTGPEQVV